MASVRAFLDALPREPFVQMNTQFLREQILAIEADTVRATVERIRQRLDDALIECDGDVSLILDEEAAR